MKSAVVIGWLGLLLTLQGVTLGYVVSTERRLVRLETIIELRAAGRADPQPQPKPALQRKEILT